MNREVTPLKPYVTPSFSGAEQSLDPELKRKLRQPMIIGGAVVGVFVVATILWAAVAPIRSAIMAQGVVRVEANRKVIRHREGGTVKAIPVKEGQHVTLGQPLLILDDVQPRASVDVFQNQYDALAAQSARFEAEATGRRVLAFPASLTNRMSDPRVAGLIRDQQLLFTTRLQFFDSQADVLNQRQSQIESQISGVQAQLDALEESVRLTKEELAGYQTLYEKGYAPKTLILRYDRSLAELAGRRGALTSEITRLRQQKGETRMQLNSLRDQRVSQAAEGLRQMQSGLSDVSPRLTAALQTLEHSVLRSPVDGYVLDLSQSTIGGVIGSGEVLMNIVPANAPLIVSARIKPADIDDVKVGMKGQVRLTAFNYRKVSPVEGDVIAVSADQLSDPKSGEGYFRADVRIPPAQLATLPKGAKLSPGMPATVSITTGTRTILSYVVSPLTDTIRDSLKED
ncbi:HlyD family type I secretion periplasmic adaptor subunit [Phenylobacterium sp.]|uniref:HlyD family type I secretion periplasmic adaptor subunit n=1 Tax=Phenylobacterium sp. TaxID=1871053 RepID=UPI00271AB71C|nr:HlyD family type I secretion periplasmic adaptor subunit [Phenylobacterium sp.]MDO8380751.1 HlyD family type I secretion periplasmic adaptor subunit [Phenylobacterium sp.]